MISDASKAMNPTLINYGDQFLSKYFYAEDLIRKSQRKDENFDGGSFRFNELIDIFTSLDICSKNKDLYKFNELDNSLTYRQTIVLKIIEKFRPKWMQRFKFGLDHVIDLRESEPNLYQCLNECGIFSEDITRESKNFINHIKSSIYSEDNNQKNKIELGAFGEELSIQYEFNKTGIRPFQQSLWNDNYGYDLKSIDENNSIKKIEVKASKNGRAFVTWNEWKTALASFESGVSHEFHLWSIQKSKKELAIIKVHDLGFIPRMHQDNHCFDNFIIQFNGFEDKFKEINFNYEEAFLN